MVKVQCIVEYDDLQLKKRKKPTDEPYSVTNERAEYLANERGLVKIVEVIPDPVEEEKAPEPKKQVAKKQNKRK